MHQANWLPIGTANKGTIQLWDGLDKHHKPVYTYTRNGEPEGGSGYRSLDFLLSTNAFVMDPVEKEEEFTWRSVGGIWQK